MSKTAVMQKLESGKLKKNLPDFRVGDTVKVGVRIVEGDKERVQNFEGIVIARKGTGLSETFSVYRVSYGEGVERVFLLHSPSVDSIVVKSQGDVRRGKLYYLRNTSGKAAKVKGRISARKIVNGSDEAQVDENENQPEVAEATTE